MNCKAFTAALVLQAAGLSTVAHADPLSDISGSLTAGDAFEADGKFYDDIPLQLEAGKRYRIDVGSEDFDTLARIYPEGGGSPLAENDDSGDSSDSQIVFVAPKSGTYLLRVTSFEAENSGGYHVQLTEMLPPVTVDRKPDATERMEFSIYNGTLRTVEGETETHNFPISVRPGQSLIVQASSGDFDTVLNIYRAGEFGGEVVTSNDDASATNSLLGYTFDEGGDFIVSLSAFDGTGEGSYTLCIGL